MNRASFGWGMHVDKNWSTLTLLTKFVGGVLRQRTQNVTIRRQSVKKRAKHLAIQVGTLPAK
jgi:hypothetical protein